MTLEDVRNAKKRIASHIYRTPLLRQPALDDLLGCEVYLKHEGLQITGSFKIRGATNKILSLTPEELKRGVAAASSGNHAMGVACAAQRLGVEAVIVMPEDANPTKLKGAAGYGATVLQVGLLSSQREEKVRELCKERGMSEIHPYADPFVAAGQGTIGIELAEDLPGLDAVVVPIGGGGLISGVATAIRGLLPDARVVGVEPAGCPRYTRSRAEGCCVAFDSVKTIADGTRTNRANPTNFEMIEKLVDDLVPVEDAWIERAMKALAANAKLVVEPSSSMGIGAGLSGDLAHLRGKKVCFVFSGGNNDLALLASILTRPETVEVFRGA